MTGSGDEARQHWSTRLRAGLLAIAVAAALLVGGGGSHAGASPAPAGAAAAGGYLYWTNFAPLRKDAGTIGRARLDGTDVNQHFIAVPNGPSGVAGLAVNCRYIYWTNEDGNEIGRANLNGTGVNQKFITGADFPDAIAAGSQYLYWANAFGKTIGRARLNGTDVNQRFIANKDFINLHGVAVAPAHLPLIGGVAPGLCCPALSDDLGDQSPVLCPELRSAYAYEDKGSNSERQHEGDEDLADDLWCACACGHHGGKAHRCGAAEYGQAGPEPPGRRCLIHLASPIQGVSWRSPRDLHAFLIYGYVSPSGMIVVARAKFSMSGYRALEPAQVFGGGIEH
jgi:hypothetical protein